MTHTEPSPRLEGLDVARALAIAGMILVNYTLVIAPNADAPAWLDAFITAISGRAAALFVVLAGVGVALLARSKPAARTIVLRRAAILLAIGLPFSAIWPPDILHFYALYLAAAALLLRAQSRTLLIALGATLLITPLLHLPFDYTKGWDFDSITYENMWAPASLARRLLFNGFHPFFPWFAFVLMGMLLARLDLASRHTRFRLFLVAAATTAALETLAFLLAGSGDFYEITLARGPMVPTPLFVLSAASSACAAIALCLEAVRWLPRAVIRPLLCTGQLALTLYLAHVLVGLWVYEDVVVAMGLPALYEPTAYAVAFIIASVLFATLWRWKCERGPLEALLRKASSAGLAAR